MTDSFLSTASNVRLISSEEAEVINEILSNYHNQNLKITYYKNGELLETTDTIKKIEIYEKRLDLTSKIKILFKDIINLEEIN